MKLFKLFSKRIKRQVRRASGAAKSTPGGRRLPKIWWKRWLWYANPKRFVDFWFTRDGARTALRLSGWWASALVAFIIVLFLWFAKDLPTPGQINSKLLAQTTRFYDSKGETVLYEVHGDQNRTVIELEDISTHMRNATVAIEDKNFYRHGAFSSFAIVRAAINNVWGKVTNNEDSIQGGSTITQQYVKNALLSPERTFARKVKELILSIQIEQLYNKDDILELYLNEIPYGAQAYGAQAAAKTYFDKDAKDLTIDEAALLAALPRAPTYYSPYGQHLDEMLARRNLIINLMREQGYISPEQADQSLETDTYAKVNDVPNLYANITAPHFVLYAEEYLKEQLGERLVNEGGLNVITTLDLDIQKKAEKALKDGIDVVDAAGGNNAALVAGDPSNGYVRAMVGSRGFNHPGYGFFNAALARRQPGSSFKPYVYATGFKSNSWGPGSVMYDVATDFGGGYRPNNYDNRFHGVNTVRWFLGNSFNIPAVKMLYIAGMQESLDQAHSMGITTLQNPEDYGLSLVLGAGEVKLADHVNAYQSFVNEGKHFEATPIIKATNAKGEVVLEHENPEAQQVLDPQIAYLISHILSDSGARSYTFGGSTQYMDIPGQSFMVKTGTTDNNRDGWMIGGTKHLIGGVWVGHSENKSMGGITSVLTGNIWAPFMQAAHKGKPKLEFERPSGIKAVKLDSITGRLPGEGTNRTHTDLFPSWYEPQRSAGVQSATINKFNNTLARSCTPGGARQEVTAYGIQAEIPSSDLAFGRWNPPVQALAKSLRVGGGSIPTKQDPCDNKPPEIEADSEKDGDTLTVTVDIKNGSYPLKNFIITVDGEQICNKSISKKGKYSCSTEDDDLISGSKPIQATVYDKAGLSGTHSSSTSFGNPPNRSIGLLGVWAKTHTAFWLVPLRLFTPLFL